MEQQQDDLNRKIFEEAVEKWSQRYKEEPGQREKHIVDRLRECHDKYITIAYEAFNKKYETSIPVVIGKHFSWVLIDKTNSIGFNGVAHHASLFQCSGFKTP